MRTSIFVLLAVAIAGCGDKSKPESAAPALDRGLVELIPGDATTVMFVDVDRSPSGTLFDQALTTVCAELCAAVAAQHGRRLDLVIDDVMVVFVDGSVVLAIDGQVAFGRDVFRGAETRRYRDVELASWEAGGQPIEIGLLRGHLLFAVEGRLDGFIDRALDSRGKDTAGRMAALMKLSVTDANFWMVADVAELRLGANLAVALRDPAEVEARMFFPSEADATAWFQKWDGAEARLAGAFPTIATTFRREVQGPNVRVRFAAPPDEALAIAQNISRFVPGNERP